MTDDYDPTALERFVRGAVGEFGTSRRPMTRAELDALERDDADGEELDADAPAAADANDATVDDRQDDESIRTGADLVGALLNGLIDIDGGYDPEDFLVWCATASASQWEEYAAAASIDPAIRVGITDLPRDLQTRIHAERLEKRRVAILEGRAPYIGQ